jgi:hypothetical protein
MRGKKNNERIKIQNNHEVIVGVLGMTGRLGRVYEHAWCRAGETLEGGPRLVQPSREDRGHGTWTKFLVRVGSLGQVRAQKAAFPPAWSPTLRLW